MDLARIDKLVETVGSTIHTPRRVLGGDAIKVGLDLGTYYTALVVLDGENRPLACQLEAADVVRDGLVVDYLGAVAVTRRLRERVMESIGLSLDRCVIALPPGTSPGDCGTHRHVAESAGMEVERMVDEPVAANAVLGIRNGAVVDVGGGTTGTAVFRDGEVVHVADDATGGIHLSLVLSGGYRLSMQEAELMKRDPLRHKEVLVAVTPVIEKIATIVAAHIREWDVSCVYLVGGTCCLPGIEKIVGRMLGIPVHRPENPLLITPVGIAMCASEKRVET